MNNCNFIGRLTADPEIKTLGSGKNIANFTIAVDREYKDGSGNKIIDFIQGKSSDSAPVAPRKQIETAEDTDDSYNGLPFPLEDA